MSIWGTSQRLFLVALVLVILSATVFVQLTQAEAAVAHPGPGVGNQLNSGSASIGGSIADLGGNPLIGSPQVTVNAIKLRTDLPGESSSGIFGVTATDGSYTITGLEAGTYLVRVVDPYLNYGIRYFEDARGYSDATRVEVREGETVTGIDFRLPRGSWITGSISAPDGALLDPAARFRVTPVSQYGSGPWTFPAVERDGKWSFRVFAPTDGDYTVKVSDDAGLYQPSEYMPQGGSKGLRVGVGEVVEGADVKVLPAGRISGTVTQCDGEPGQSCACVLAVPVNPSGRSDGKCASAPDGVFQIGGLAPGAYRLKISKTGQADFWYPSTLIESQAAKLNVRAGEVTSGIVQNASPTYSVAGTVRAPRGKPFTLEDRICVALDDSVVVQPRREVCLPSGQDSFTFPDVPIGHYSLAVQAASRRYLTTWFPQVDDPARAEVVAVQEGLKPMRIELLDNKIPTPAPVTATPDWSETMSGPPEGPRGGVRRATSRQSKGASTLSIRAIPVGNWAYAPTYVASKGKPLRIQFSTSNMRRVHEVLVVGGGIGVRVYANSFDQPQPKTAVLLPLMAARYPVLVIYTDGTRGYLWLEVQ